MTIFRRNHIFTIINLSSLFLCLARKNSSKIMLIVKYGKIKTIIYFLNERLIPKTPKIDTKARTEKNNARGSQFSA